MKSESFLYSTLYFIYSDTNEVDNSVLGDSIARVTGNSVGTPPLTAPFTIANRLKTVNPFVCFPISPQFG